MTVGLGDVDARADSSGHRLFNQIYLPGAGLNARVDDGALLHLRDAGGNADDDSGLEKGEAGHLPDELPEHPLRHVIVGDNALPKGTDRNDVAGGTAQHSLSVRTHLKQFPGVFIQRHHAGFVQNDSLSLDVYQNRSGTEIDTDIPCHGHASTSCTFRSILCRSFKNYEKRLSPHTIIRVHYIGEDGGLQVHSVNYENSRRFFA
ncbi:hypothetical protein SDC9_119325 [bioreactor metagenome]|uniref:Uncharacterized protein n=1 Tax=bioreactor metagenome TaxID=1076179 RepID=A0A645C3X5_9ZZZZ